MSETPAGPNGSAEGTLVVHDMTDGTSRVIVGPKTGYPYYSGDKTQYSLAPECHFAPTFIAMCPPLLSIAKVSLFKSALVVVALVLAPALAMAASKAKQGEERAARKACLNGDYAKGISILSDLFVATQDTTYIFNQGRCLEQNKRYEDAIEKFKEYLRAGGEKLSQDDRDAAQKHLAECKATLAEERSNSVMMAPPAPQAFVLPAPAPAAPPAPTQEAPPAEASSRSGTGKVAPKTMAARTGAGLRIAGIAVTSVGVAGVATGVLLNLKANSMVNQMQTTPGDYSHAKDNSRQTYETSAWVAYGAGAACIATGIILYTFGIPSPAKSSGDIALAPTFATGQAGAVLAGTF